MSDPVLIVGAGPSGLMFAHELSRFSIPFLLIDKDMEKSPYSRAVGVQIRTLEIFSALGLFHELSKKSQAVNSIEIYAENRPPIAMPIEGIPSNFNNLLIIDQPHTEKVLEDVLSRFSEQILRGVELIDFEQDEDGVVARLRGADHAIETKRFSYIIGADGAHSAVRKAMSNQFLGSTYEEAFILADAECIHGLNPHAFRIFFKKKRFFAMIPMHGKDHYRLISVRRKETKKEGPPPTIEEFRDLAKEVVPFLLEIQKASWVSRFFVQCRSASHYQEGRLFLVGDSAHIHSPAGGQGMNTGLQDSFNLAWKLAMTIRGMAMPALLATYHSERKPVGDYLIERTDRLFKFMVKSSIWARLLRRLVLPRLARSLKLRSRVFTIGSQTAIRYEKGALCERDEHEIEGKDIRIGVRIPNLLLISSQLKKTDLHTLISSLCFSWLFFFPKSTDKRAAREVLDAKERIEKAFGAGVRCHLIFASDFDAEKSMSEGEYFVTSKPSWDFRAGFVVTRPDHHVFCMGELGVLDHAEESLTRFLKTRSSR